MKGIETGAVTATGALAGGGGLSASLTGLSPTLAGLGPAAVAGLGAAGLAGAIYLASKEVEKLESKKELFGTFSVSDETLKKVEKFKVKVDDLTGAVLAFGGKGKTAFEDVKKAVDALTSSTYSEIDSATAKLQEEAKNLGFSSDIINSIKSNGSKAKEEVKNAAKSITSIVAKANKEQTDLTVVQRAQISTEQQKIAEQEVNALNITGKKKKALMSALSGDLNKISTDQATDYINKINLILEKSDASYSKQQSQLKDLLNKGTITTKEYAEKEKELQNTHEVTSQAYLSTLKNMILVQGQNLTQGTSQYQHWQSEANNALSRYGLSIKDIMNQSGTAIDAITKTSESLKVWNSIPTTIKELLGNNTNFKNSEKEASNILIAWNHASPESKKLLATNLVKNPTMSAQAIINSLRGNTVGLYAVDKTGSAVLSAATTVSKLQGKSVDITGNPNPFNSVVSNILQSNLGTVSIGITANTSKKATGDSNFSGGLAWVNDQKGSLYKELITLPNGESFIPQNRDVVLPLPKGTNILKASETAKLIPKYANGTTTKIPANAKIFSDMRTASHQLAVGSSGSSNIGQTQLLNQILRALTGNGTNNDVINSVKLLAKRPVDVYVDRRKITDEVGKQQTLNQSISNIINGRN